VVVIGVCGLPAGGKSAVAKFLEKFGALRVDADTIARKVLESPEVTAQVVRQFGASVLGTDGKIDRPRLGSIVFGDDESAGAALRYLESIVHPLTRCDIRIAVEQAMTDRRPVAVLDIPLLFEGGWDAWCDEVWFVDTPRASNLEFARQRGWDAETLDRRIARQISAGEKRRLSTQVVENRGSLDDLGSTIESWWLRRIGLVDAR
jgi:dephospho-CoA kinase